VKACKAGEGPSTLNLSPRTLNVSCFPVKDLISMAYGETVNGRHDSFPMNHIEGGPSWIEMDPPAYSNTYAINARTDQDASPELITLMFQRLLEDRFQLRVRHEKRPATVYSLSVDPRGSKLKSFDGSCTLQDVPPAEAVAQTAAKPFCRMNFVGNGGRSVIDIHGITMGTFASRLGRYEMPAGDLDGPIVDKTGLAGFFDIHLEFAFAQASGNAIDMPPLLADALREHLGLRLERTTGTDEFLVVEHVERPSEN